MKRKFGEEYIKNSNWRDFKTQRHRTQTDQERRADREAKYGKYEPKEDSNFHFSKRGYTQEDLKKSWEAYFRGFNPFQIRNVDDFRKNLFFGGKEKTNFDRAFDDAVHKYN